MVTYYLPAPGQSSFEAPHSVTFWIPTNPRTWTLDMTLYIRREEAEMIAQWKLECAFFDNMERMQRKQCRTPDVIYAPGFALPSQMTLWGDVA